MVSPRVASLYEAKVTDMAADSARWGSPKIYRFIEIGHLDLCTRVKVMVMVMVMARVSMRLSMRLGVLVRVRVMVRMKLGMRVRVG